MGKPLLHLIDLEPRLLRYEKREDGVYHTHAATVAEAQGVGFLCPECYVKNGGKVGTHMVICWSESRGVPKEAFPGPGRWLLVGKTLKGLTLNGEPGRSRSVLITAGCNAHFFVTKGVIEWC